MEDNSASETLPPILMGDQSPSRAAGVIYVVDKS